MFSRIINLIPSKFKEIMAQYPIAYMPVSPVEWHGEHLPFGTDAIRAEWLLTSVAKRVGGILFPTEYCGTDGIVRQSGRELWYLESIVGEMLPGNFLVEESHFAERIKRIIINVQRNGFKLLVICSGHLSPQQISILESFEREIVMSNFKIILWHSEVCNFTKELTTEDYLHAGVEEASEMKFICPDEVDVTLIGSNELDRKLGLNDSLRPLISEDFGEKRLMREVEELTDKINNIRMQF